MLIFCVVVMLISLLFYEVDRARDGGSFSNRRVVAIQHGKQIFNMAVSFQELEPGVQHQFDPPDVPGPDELLDLKDISRDALARGTGANESFCYYRTSVLCPSRADA